MSLLENPLIQKYFGCGCETAGCLHPHEAILKAMQEPIRINERYIALSGPHVLGVMQGVLEEEGFHPYNLRLPSAHQKKECEHVWLKASGEDCYKCGTHRCEAKPVQGQEWCHCNQHLGNPKPAPEPEKCDCPPGILGHCHDPKCPHPAHALEKPSAVEERITWIRDRAYSSPALREWLEPELRTLVRLAREG